MFKINDYIMYGNVGVCKVMDITNETIMNSEEKEYYVLNPIYSKYSKNTVIKIPTDNDKIAMRELMTKTEVDTLINDMATKDIVWIEDDRERIEEFKSMLKTGKSDDLMMIVKSIYSDKKNKKAKGKKTHKGNDDIMQTAEKLINQEFATILDIKPEEVRKYITSHMKK
ncbi:CarD family transcriptional regulator [Clostridium sp. B9]|uniref:CarD family transcriptional regulator n=1 Tax=Clostridium sp. B9 TaxID=3423224 RepID=UPI003D2EC81A